ncbi:MAG: 16S rRNA processing protein RimM [Alphaproteobacteria bacterium]|nr:16S rRNA processing protein RimM [Phycisphaerales bacterium]MCB9674332.1 16S rRNA processing protein RimM [Alphaproteobacteria bacterium]
MPPERKSRLAPAGPVHEDEVELGSISGVFGVRGEVRLHLHNRDSSLLDDGREVVLITPEGRFRATLRTRPGAGKRVLGVIDGIEDRDEAEALIGATFTVPLADLPEPDDDEYYLDEVVGMSVCTGEKVHGRVVEVHTTGPVEVFELDTGAYLPSTGDHILAIDRVARVIEVAEGAVHEV